MKCHLKFSHGCILGCFLSCELKRLSWQIQIFIVRFGYKCFVTFYFVGAIFPLLAMDEANIIITACYLYFISGSKNENLF